MMRQQGSAEVKKQKTFLTDQLCRLSSPQLMARVSGHLRNCAVAEIIATLGVLDSHPRVKGRPRVSVAGAAFQQMTGTHTNPFTHVAPSNLLLNGKKLTEFFTSRKAQALVERVFGMGVMAPHDWSDLATFPLSPGQLNRADSTVERFGVDTGLVAAFEITAAAVEPGTWDASSRRQHNASSLLDHAVTYYRGAWKPNAIMAYDHALTRMSTDLSLARKAGDGARQAAVQHRIELVDLQLTELRTNTPKIADLVQNVISATSDEQWT